jgi:hypothetical protein
MNDHGHIYSPLIASADAADAAPSPYGFADIVAKVKPAETTSFIALPIGSA